MFLLDQTSFQMVQQTYWRYVNYCSCLFTYLMTFWKFATWLKLIYSNSSFQRKRVIQCCFFVNNIIIPEQTYVSITVVPQVNFPVQGPWVYVCLFAGDGRDFERVKEKLIVNTMASPSDAWNTHIILYTYFHQNHCQPQPKKYTIYL